MTPWEKAKVPSTTSQRKMNPRAFALMVKAMSERAHSKHELAELTGLHLWTIRHYVDALHNNQMAHIVKWDKDSRGRDTTAYFALGFGIDKQREAKSGALKMRELRARKRKEAMGLIPAP